MAQVETQNSIAGLQGGHKNRRVGIGTRVRLHVGPRRTEKFFHPVNGNLLYFINYLTTTVISLAR